jgi:hypothetical protein
MIYTIYTKSSDIRRDWSPPKKKKKKKIMAFLPCSTKRQQVFRWIGFGSGEVQFAFLFKREYSQLVKVKVMSFLMIESNEFNQILRILRTISKYSMDWSTRSHGKFCFGPDQNQIIQPCQYTLVGQFTFQAR